MLDLLLAAILVFSEPTRVVVLVEGTCNLTPLTVDRATTVLSSCVEEDGIARAVVEVRGPCRVLRWDGAVIDQRYCAWLPEVP